MKFKDCKSKHFACVYCLEFPNGMKYVGKTHDLSDRVAVYERFGGSSKVDSAIKEFGFDSVDVSILARIDNLKRVETELCLGILEVKFIRDLNTIYPNGYNVSLGGELLGIPIEHLTTDENTIKSLMNGNKILLEYDTEGNFVKEYPSIARFAYEKGYVEDNVRVAVDKMHAYKGKHILRTKRYDYIPEKIEVDEIKVIERVKYKTIVEEKRVVKQRDITYVEVPVVVYDLNGDFVGEYESKSAACRSLYMYGHTMPFGVYKNGYIAFKKEGDDYPKKIEGADVLRYKATDEVYRPAVELDDKPVLDTTGFGLGRRGNKHLKLRHTFPVDQFKLNGEFVARYNSIRDASDASNIPYCQIYNNVMGTTRMAKGYIWRAVGDNATNVSDDIKRRANNKEKEKPEKVVVTADDLFNFASE
jgi:hypothetical protein